MAKALSSMPIARQAAERAKPVAEPRTLAIDIGGTHLKAGVLDAFGAMLVAADHVPTPLPSEPAAVIAALIAMVLPLGGFDRVSVGFPGVVRAGRILTAPNLGTDVWHDYPLASDLAQHFGKPVRVLNDASIQGAGAIDGVGLECVITLGTGFGFALFENGRLAPHLEVGQHPCTKGYTYDHYLGDAALHEVGAPKWNKRLQKAIGFLDTLVTYDMLLIGGGNARLIAFKLPNTIRIVPNSAGVTGGVRLWYPAMASVFEDAPEISRPAPEGVTAAPEVARGRKSRVS